MSLWAKPQSFTSIVRLLRVFSLSVSSLRMCIFTILYVYSNTFQSRVMPCLACHSSSCRRIFFSYISITIRNQLARLAIVIQINIILVYCLQPKRKSVVPRVSFFFFFDRGADCSIRLTLKRSAAKVVSRSKQPFWKAMCISWSYWTATVSPPMCHLTRRGARFLPSYTYGRAFHSYGFVEVRVEQQN